MEEIKYIIRSGNGYFMGIGYGGPEMTSDPLRAGRFDKGDFLDTFIAYIRGSGFDAETVKLRIGKIEDDQI